MKNPIQKILTTVLLFTSFAAKAQPNLDWNHAYLKFTQAKAASEDGNSPAKILVELCNFKNQAENCAPLLSERARSCFVSSEATLQDLSSEAYEGTLAKSLVMFPLALYGSDTSHAVKLLRFVMSGLAQANHNKEVIIGVAEATSNTTRDTANDTVKPDESTSSSALVAVAVMTVPSAPNQSPVVTLPRRAFMNPVMQNASDPVQEDNLIFAFKKIFTALDPNQKPIIDTSCE